MTSLNEKPGRHGGAEILSPRSRPLQTGYPSLRARGRIEGKDGRFVVDDHRPAGLSPHYRARKIVLATGYYDIPNLLNVPGEDLDKVLHYYKEPHPYYNHDVAVIGAKNSAAIAALELYWTGARVTLIHRGREISRAVKYWIKPNIENRIKNGEIKAFFHTKVTEIRRDSIRCSHTRR